MRLLLFGTCGAVFLYGLFRPESPPQLFEQSDKALHLLAFAALALSSRLAFPRMPAWLLWGGLLALAPLLEWLQKVLQPARQFSELDIAANLLGVVLAWLGWQCLQALRRHLLPSQ
ncbi:VanZ like family protein [compost metagenome]